MAVDIYGKFNSIHSLAIYHSGYDRPSSARIPKFSQHNKLCKIPLLSVRRRMHITGDPVTFCPVCQGDMEKMLTFTTDGSQPLACAMLILFCWSHSMISVLSFTPLWLCDPQGTSFLSCPDCPSAPLLNLFQSKDRRSQSQFFGWEASFPLSFIYSCPNHTVIALFLLCSTHYAGSTVC